MLGITDLVHNWNSDRSGAPECGAESVAVSSTGHALGGMGRERDSGVREQDVVVVRRSELAVGQVAAGREQSSMDAGRLF